RAGERPARANAGAAGGGSGKKNRARGPSVRELADSLQFPGRRRDDVPGLGSSLRPESSRHQALDPLCRGHPFVEHGDDDFGDRRLDADSSGDRRNRQTGPGAFRDLRHSDEDVGERTSAADLFSEMAMTAAEGSPRATPSANVGPESAAADDEGYRSSTISVIRFSVSGSIPFAVETNRRARWSGPGEASRTSLIAAQGTESSSVSECS